jgi:phage terminase Nu1 subunit (DNA packaging protein)
MPAAAPSADAARTVGKAELADALGWSRPRLDRTLDRDPKFPVKTRGGRAGGWVFDLDEVEAYLGIAVEPEPAEVEEEEPAQVVSLARRRAAPVEHEGEATARQRREAAQAAWYEDKLREKRGELVKADPLRLSLATAVLKASTRLNALPEILVRRLNLRPDMAAVIRQEIDEVRRTLVREIETELLADG